jgi:ABC-type lipoprotein release transport system permease subunit
MGARLRIGKLSVIIVPTATTAVAAWIPARRAARVDPRITLNESS